MGTVALQNMLFANGLAELKVGANFAVGKPAGPKGRPANASEAAMPDNIVADSAQNPVEADDFENALATETEQQNNESPANQTDTSTEESQTENPETNTAAGDEQVPLVWQGQVRFVSAEGFDKPQANAIERLSELVENQLSDVPGKAVDAVNAVLEKLAGDGQPIVAIPGEAAGDGKVLEAAKAGVDTNINTINADGKQQPVENANTEQNGQQELTGEFKNQPQVLAENEIKVSFEQGVEKQTGEVEGGLKNTEQPVEKPVQDDSAIKNIGEELTGEKNLNQQLNDTDDTDNADDAEVSVDEPNIKAAVQQQFNNSLNTQVNVNNSGAEQISPLAEAVAAEPKTQTVGVQQSSDVLVTDTAEQASRQIQNVISTSISKGQDEIAVQLNPPELGRVSIKLQQEDGQITGLLEFSRNQTRLEVEQLLPGLVRGLQDAGIAVRRVDVVQTQTDNAGQQQFKEYLGQDNTGGQQQNPGSGQSNTGSTGYDWAGQSVNYYDTADWAEESVISDKAVNVLV